jgi:hypothetical protein
MLDTGRLDRSLEQITIKQRTTAAAAAVPNCPAQLPPVRQNNGGACTTQLPIRKNGPVQPLLDDPFFAGPIRILTHDGAAARTQYRPPEPQLKILKRPTADSCHVGKPSESQLGVKQQYFIYSLADSEERKTLVFNQMATFPCVLFQSTGTWSTKNS